MAETYIIPKPIPPNTPYANIIWYHLPETPVKKQDALLITHPIETTHLNPNLLTKAAENGPKKINLVYIKGVRSQF